MKRTGCAAENFSGISKIAVNLINQQSIRRGKKIKYENKKKAGWGNDYLAAILAHAG